MKQVIIALVALLVLTTPAFASRNDDNKKVNICHTGNGENWESVKVDKDAWDEHDSAHSDHELDFLITKDKPCPPVEEEPVIVCPEGQILQGKECESKPPVATPSAPPTITQLPNTGEALTLLGGLGVLSGSFGLALYQARRFFRKD